MNVSLCTIVINARLNILNRILNRILQVQNFYSDSTLKVGFQSTLKSLGSRFSYIPKIISQGSFLQLAQICSLSTEY